MKILINGDKDKMLEYLVELINTAKKIHPDIWEDLKREMSSIIRAKDYYGIDQIDQRIPEAVMRYCEKNTLDSTTNYIPLDKIKEKTRCGKSIDKIPLSSKGLKLCGTNYSSNIKWLCEKCFKDDLDGCGVQNCKYLVPVRIEKAVDEYVPIHPVLDCQEKPGDSLCGDLGAKVDDTVRLCDKCLKDWNIYGCGGNFKGALHLYHI